MLSRQMVFFSPSFGVSCRLSRSPSRMISKLSGAAVTCLEMSSHSRICLPSIDKISSFSISPELAAAEFGEILPTFGASFSTPM